MMTSHDFPTPITMRHATQCETTRDNAKQREANETTIQRDSNKKGQADDDERLTTDEGRRQRRRR